jgi:phosphofructokinase-like protein
MGRIIVGLRTVAGRPVRSTMPPIRRIGLLTGGGDCPGLNALVRAVTKGAAAEGLETIGILDGFLGLIEDRTRPLTPDDVSGIIAQGGTILGASNKANPARFCTGRDGAGRPIIQDVAARCLETVARHRLDALVVAGGDGTMACARSLFSRGVNCIGVPKTIDNDLHGTDLSFGFLTAVQIATDALDRVRTTAASHHRVIAVEVMGRGAGWLALHAGIAAGADAILIPEIPFDLDALCGTIDQRRQRGRAYSILCVAEGAAPRGGQQVVARMDAASPDPVRFGGIAKAVADAVEARTGTESRYVVLGHVQRGGTPVAADRVLGTQFGYHAVRLLRQGARDRMVAWRDGCLADIPIADAADKPRSVPPGHPLLDAARSVGTSFGD